MHENLHVPTKALRRAGCLLLVFILVATAAFILLPFRETAQGSANEVQLISVSSAGVKSNGNCSNPVMSGEGRYVAFSSQATDLVDGRTTDGYWQVYRRDTITGETVLVSQSATGVVGNNDSDQPSICAANGTVVTFYSTATNLIDGTPTSGNQIFAKNLATGAVNVVSCSATGVLGNGACYDAFINYSGMYVVFKSYSSNLIDGDPTSTVGNIFRKNLFTGAVDLCSQSLTAVHGNGPCRNPVLTMDGNIAIFSSTASNLIDGTPTGAEQVFRKNLTTGVVDLVSKSALGAQGNATSMLPTTSFQGDRIAFQSDASNLTVVATSGTNVFLKDMTSGAVTLISSSSTGVPGNANSGQPSMDYNASRVAFNSDATNLVDAYTSGTIYVKNTQTGVTYQGDVSAAGVPANGIGFLPCVSPNAAFLAWTSGATNLIPGDLMTGLNIFRKQLPAAPNPSSFFFAEGTTRAGFEEYLCIMNPTGTAEDAVITYMFPDGTTQGQLVSVGATTRMTIRVNDVVGANRDVSVMVGCDGTIVAERPMYMNYGGIWTGAHDVIGAPQPYTSFYFAEGTTRAGFDEYLCLMNPYPTATTAYVTYIFQGETPVQYPVPLGATTRVTIRVNDVVGPNRDVSMLVTADSPIVAERPMYMDYADAWPGAHDVVGATEPLTSFYFAEGTTRAGFEEYLCLLNPSPAATVAHVTYMFPGGATQAQEVPLAGNTRVTIRVRDVVGADRDVSVRITANAAIVAERPMYCAYGGSWTGAHDVIGIQGPEVTFNFAEGSTRAGIFDEYLCLMNPYTLATTAHVIYMFPDGTTTVRNVPIGATERVTIKVNDVVGYDKDVSMLVTSDAGIVAERPMYCCYGGVWPGATDVIGYTPQ